MSDEKKKCSVCGGSGLNKPKLQDVKDGEEIQYQSIECQHCHGTGKEPD